MNDHKPRVSIGLPVHNGEKYLEETLDSVLKQTFSDFELIIYDNASTDRTPEICRAFLEQDNRIRYFKSGRNEGASANFNRAFRASRGEYFKWIAHDDLIAPSYLEKCVEVLDRDDSVALCCSRVVLINEAGDILGDFDLALERIASPRPQDRFGDLILNDLWCYEVFGLVRAEALSRTRLIDGFVASDRTLRAELGLIGKIHEIPEYLTLSRDHPERSIRNMPAHHLRAGWFDPALAGKRIFPHWRIFLEYLKTVRRSTLSLPEKAACCPHLLRWLTIDMNWARMIADCIIAVKPESWKLLIRIGGNQDTRLKNAAHVSRT